MAPEQRRQILLAFLAVVLAGAAYRLWTQAPGTAGGAPTTSNTRSASRAQGGPAPMTAPDVHLEALSAERTAPEEVERNVFRFKPRAAPPPPPTTTVKPVAPTTTGPPPPSAVPPIPLKFIGLWELPEQKKKVAMLTDGKGGVPILGSEGDAIEGRYRILRIGVESIELAYLDGRGRQTIRMTGQ